MTGFWPGLGWCPSQCLPMRTRPGWTGCFTAPPAKARGAGAAAGLSCSAPLRQTSTSLRAGMCEGPRSPKCFTPLSVTRARERVPWCNPSALLQHQGDGRGARLHRAPAAACASRSAHGSPAELTWLSNCASCACAPKAAFPQGMLTPENLGMA